MQLVPCLLQFHANMYYNWFLLAGGLSAQETEVSIVEVEGAFASFGNFDSAARDPVLSSFGFTKNWESEELQDRQNDLILEVGTSP